MALPRGHMFYIGLYKQNMKKSSDFKTLRPRALIFDMKPRVMDLYQVCSN